MDGSRGGNSAWAEAGAALDQLIGATRAAWSLSDDAPAKAAAPSDPAAILNQAAMMAFSSLLRFWVEAATICGSRSVLASLGGELSEVERRRLIEELRGLMRELGDLASREGRRFQSDLAALALRLAASGSPPTQPAAPRRYARAKP